MNATTAAASSAFAVLATADVAAIARNAARVRIVTKTLVMPALAAAAVAAGAWDSTAGRWLLAALALSWLGDVSLLSDTEPRFVGGLASFFGAHLCFLAAFSALGEFTALPALVALAIVLAMFATVGRRVIPASGREGGTPLAAAVAAYMLVIGAMVVMAWGTGRPLVAMGAIVFMASDAILALDKFVRPREWADLAVMVTYVVGQALIVAGTLA